MKVIIDKLQISDDDLITDVKNYEGPLIIISKLNRNNKFLIDKTNQNYHRGIGIDDMLPVIVYGENINNFDCYKKGEIKLTIEILN